MDWEAVSKELSKPLDPSAIKPPPKGKFGEYVEALHVIREANRIFGFNGWSYDVTRLERTHFEVVELQGRDGPYKQLRCSYLCGVRMTVDGVTREGLAVGVGNGKPENAGDVIESAVKEAETDALKRALRTFGNTFGLALYEKDKACREVGYSTPQVVMDAVHGAETLEALQTVWVANKKYHTDPEFLKAKDARKAELTAPPKKPTHDLGNDQTPIDRSRHA